MPFESEEMVAIFIAQQECVDEEATEPRCGAPVHWCIHDSCDAAIDTYLEDPMRGVQVAVPGAPTELVQQCLLMSLRTKVLALCRGSA